MSAHNTEVLHKRLKEIDDRILEEERVLGQSMSSLTTDQMQTGIAQLQKEREKVLLELENLEGAKANDKKVWGK